jgi:hypothetical protein
MNQMGRIVIGNREQLAWQVSRIAKNAGARNAIDSELHGGIGFIPDLSISFGCLEHREVDLRRPKRKRFHPVYLFGFLNENVIK